MDQDTFIKSARLFQHWHTAASDIASIFIIPVLGFGVVCGFLLTWWIFRGGLSRHSFRIVWPHGAKLHGDGVV
jgi:hypothetical protein